MECEVCGSWDMVVVHHVYFGTGNRKISDKYDCCKINLCRYCHEKIHRHGDREFDLKLKRQAQREFEEKFSHEKFMDEFGRSYLWK